MVSKADGRGAGSALEPPREYRASQPLWARPPPGDAARRVGTGCRVSTGRLGREARACRMGGKNWVPAGGSVTQGAETDLQVVT